MDRVGFLIEQTGERLGCLLNPESVEMTRRAGVGRRRTLQGPLTGRGLSDDPPHYTGGGVTELRLDLLFDVNLPDSTIQTNNVRDLTAPFWALAENREGEDGYGRAVVVRFVWGKAWNIPAVVTEMAERYEYFSPEGIPQRAWVRMRLRRVPEPGSAHEPPAGSTERAYDLLAEAEGKPIEPELWHSHEMLGGAPGPGGALAGPVEGERLDQVAQRAYGDPSLWRLLAAFNNIDDPHHVTAGLVLRLPPLSGPPTP